MRDRKPVKNLILFVLLACTASFTAFSPAPAELKAVLYFDFNDEATSIYQKIMSLQLQEARTELDVFKQQAPNNLIGLFLDNYHDFMTIFSSDNKSDFNRLKKNMDVRLAKIARGDRSSPYYLYTQAEIRLQWAFLHLRYEQYLSAMSDVKQAYALLDENQRRYPDFIANKKSLGVMHVAIGNVPDEYKWAIKALGGMSGDMEQGMRELEEVLSAAQKQNVVFEEETTVLYGIVLSYFNNAAEIAFKKMKSSKINPSKNPIAAFTTAVIAMRAGYNDEAIRLLQQAPSGGSYASFPFKDFLLGITKLRRLDKDAYQPLEQFLNNSKGENSIKEGYQKLAWFQLVNNNESGYYQHMNNIKNKGATHSEPDKAALKEAENGVKPDQKLLKARLLFDGGYYQRAYELLVSSTNPYSERMFQLEYQYRMGRIVHKLGKLQEAEQYYQQTIQYGAQDPWYFACNAALQLGFLYESQKNTDKARAAFKQCLSLKPTDYAAGLHAQAKAGLSRLKKK